MIDSAVLAELCADLSGILKAELAARNVVDETARDYPALVNVWLRRPFRVPAGKLPKHVVFRKLDDPHYWLAEYQCSKHNHVLACKFGVIKNSGSREPR